MSNAVKLAQYIANEEVDVSSGWNAFLKDLLFAYEAELSLRCRQGAAHDWANWTSMREAPKKALQVFTRIRRLRILESDWKRAKESVDTALRGIAVDEDVQQMIREYEELGLGFPAEDYEQPVPTEASGRVRSNEQGNEELIRWGLNPPSDKFSRNLLALRLMVEWSKTVGNLAARIDVLWSMVGPTLSTPSTEARIRRATNLYLLGLEPECVVFSCAAIEAELAERWAQLKNKGEPPVGVTLVREVVHKDDRNGLSLRTDVENLMHARNNMVHPTTRRTAEGGKYTAADAVRILALVLSNR